MVSSRQTIWQFTLLVPLVAVGAVRAVAQGAVAPALSGTATDAHGAVVPGADVTLICPRSGVEQTVKTGSAGEFAFGQLTSGDCQITVQAPGFAVQSHPVSYAGVAIRLTVVLSASTARSEMTVTATSHDAVEPAHVDITAEQMDRMPTQSVSSRLSSLITMTTPGVSADSNGSFHPLGDHAEASFLVDGQPITDQQSRTFSTQVSLNALQSIEVREGAPGADVGDKTSLVIVAQTRSGLDQRTPHGSFALTRSSFASSTASANVAVGSARLGSFTAMDALNSARFLDTPEIEALHASGNAQNLFQRVDYKVTDATRVQLNASLSRSWFQTPNTYDQQAQGQNQRQTVVSYNLAPQVVHLFNNHAFQQTNAWVRQDKVRYRPSGDFFADTPAYLQQARRLTNAGARSEVSYNEGRHNATGGVELKHTALAEQFATGITDPRFNSPCNGPDGSPSSLTTVTDPSQCGAAGLSANSGFLPGLLRIDLTRGGTLYTFQGSAGITQLALFGQDFLTLGKFKLGMGLRYDAYDGLVRSHGLQPRVGLVYSAAPLRTNFHLNYSRVFLTPYNENLIVASSTGPGSASAALGASNSAVLHTGHRNQFNVGMETSVRTLSLGAEYFWKFTYGAYDFDVLLNSPLTFPTQFRKSKIDGGLVRLNLNPLRGWNGFVTVSHVRSRLFGPEVGGISFSAPYANVARPDHDQGLAINVNLRYQFGSRGPWINSSYRYDGGLVAVAVPDIVTALQLTGDEQQQMGFHCGAVFATVTAPLRTCAAGAAATRIRIPAAGTENDDRNPPRIAVRNTVDLSVGEDNLFHHERQSLGIRADVVNLNNTKALYNFLSTFSGTHFLTTRAVTVGLRYTF